ncbi:MAG: RnfABCDGE type electron transport complex subunit D [Clostridia bacterium]|nr:RnfABCDGE type electron transport complex subunit D [Clostridia bacterium]
MIQKSRPPYIRSSQNTSYAYLIVLVALIPCICSAVFSYGIRAFVLVLSSALLFLLFDTFFSKMLGNASRMQRFVDLNSLVNGIIFGLLLPANTSLLIVVIGALFGSFVIKQLFGGLGNSLFNQAASSRLFVELMFPNYLLGFSQPFTDYLKTDTLLRLKPAISENVITTNFKAMYFAEILNGSYSTLIGLGSVFTVLIGMLYLVLRKTTKPYVSIFYCISAILSYAMINSQLFEGDILKEGFREVAIFAVTSGVLFAASYLLAVYSNVPIGFRSSIIAGALSGFLAAFLYTRTSVGITICVPVLMVNLITPVLEYLIPHRHTKRVSFTSDKKEVE